MPTYFRRDGNTPHGVVLALTGDHPDFDRSGVTSPNVDTKITANSYPVWRQGPARVSYAAA